MGLSCECGDNEDSDLGWYEKPNDFSKIRETAVCSSCQAKIEIGETVIRIDGYRNPDEDEQIQWNIGEEHEVPLDTVYLCEKCGDLYFSLDEMGFCVSPHDDMDELLAEYHENYGSKAVLDTYQNFYLALSVSGQAHRADTR